MGPDAARREADGAMHTCRGATHESQVREAGRQAMGGEEAEKGWVKWEKKNRGREGRVRREAEWEKGERGGKE